MTVGIRLSYSHSESVAHAATVQIGRGYRDCGDADIAYVCRGAGEGECRGVKAEPVVLWVYIGGVSQSIVIHNIAIAESVPRYFIREFHTDKHDC